MANELGRRRGSGYDNLKPQNRRYHGKKFTPNFREGQGFADARKKRVVTSYRKLLQKEGRAAQREGKVRNVPITNIAPRRKLSAFQRAQEEYQKTIEAKEKQRKEREERLREKAEAIKKYKEKKVERFKKLSMKTKHGQPVMKGRLELLLEQIKQQVGAESS